MKKIYLVRQYTDSKIGNHEKIQFYILNFQSLFRNKNWRHLVYLPELVIFRENIQRYHFSKQIKLLLRFSLFGLFLCCFGL